MINDKDDMINDKTKMKRTKQRIKMKVKIKGNYFHCRRKTIKVVNSLKSSDYDF